MPQKDLVKRRAYHKEYNKKYRKTEKYREKREREKQWKRTEEGRKYSREKMREWRVLNPEKVAAQQKGRRLQLRFQTFKRDNFTCQYCGRKAPDVVLQIDHILPRSRGGLNSKDNLVTACIECNIGKCDAIL